MMTDLEREAIRIACEAIGAWENGGPVALGALCVLQDMLAAAPAVIDKPQFTSAEHETAVETLRHVIDCLRKNGIYTDEEGEATDYLEPLLSAAAPSVAQDERGAKSVDMAALGDLCDELFSNAANMDLSSGTRAFSNVVALRLSRIIDGAASPSANVAQGAGAEVHRVKVDRECPRCHVRAYHWGNAMGVANRIECVNCGHAWRGRIKKDEQDTLAAHPTVVSVRKEEQCKSMN